MSTYASFRKKAAVAGGRRSDCRWLASAGEPFPGFLVNADGHAAVGMDDHGTLDDDGVLEHQGAHAFGIVAHSLASGFVKLAPEQALAVEEHVAGGLRDPLVKEDGIDPLLPEVVELEREVSGDEPFEGLLDGAAVLDACLLYTSPSPRD